MKLKVVSLIGTAKELENKVNDTVATLVGVKDIKFTEVVTMENKIVTTAYILYTDKSR